MKKLMLTSLMAVFAVSAANAAPSYFVGGSAALKGANGEHNTAWYVAPEFGWHLSDNWDAGLAAGFAYDNGITSFNGEALVDDEGNAYTVDKYTYGVKGFARYKIAQFGALNVLLDGSVGLQGQTYDDDENTESLWSLTAEVSPMVTYNLSDSFTLYAKLNFLGANAGYTFKNKDLDVKNSWEFKAFGDSSDVLNTGDFKIGFYYNF
ncbi:MAG: hypothetical protein K2M34_00745 [Alphaproteobacteria bacterium]|nr:hypothetical protein [Alphaproteobacteria bacterium]